jgi:hypothetical protein
MNAELYFSHSQDIKELISALSKAQGQMKPAVFNRVNPHYRSRYADFTSCMDACREPLSTNGLAIIQTPQIVNEKLTLVTILAHSSGQWMKAEFPISAKTENMQSLGSAMTYAKRYSLCGMVGIVADEEGDDDAEAAVGRGRQEDAPKAAIKPVLQKINNSQISSIKELEGKLDKECKDKLYLWLSSAYKIDKIEDIISDNFPKVLGAFENAVKFMDQKKIEVMNA